MHITYSAATFTFTCAVHASVDCASVYNIWLVYTGPSYINTPAVRTDYILSVSQIRATLGGLHNDNAEAKCVDFLLVESVVLLQRRNPRLLISISNVV